MADKLHASLYAVRCWEQGKSDPSHDTLVAICKLYGVSADYLLGLTDEDPIYSQRRQKNNLNQENLATLKRFEAFLFVEQVRNKSHGTISPRRFRTTVLTDLYDTTKDIKQAQTAAGHTTAAMTLKHYIKGRHQHTNTATPIASVYGVKN